LNIVKYLINSINHYFVTPVNCIDALVFVNPNIRIITQLPSYLTWTNQNQKEKEFALRNEIPQK